MSLWRCATCGDLDKRNYIDKCMRCGGQMTPADVKASEVLEEVQREQQTKKKAKKQS